MQLDKKDSHSKDTIGRFLNMISRKSNLFLLKELNNHNLEIVPNQIMFLMTLYREGKLRQDEFTQIHYIDKGNSAKSLKELEKNGFIYKVRDEKDKRVYIVYPTEKALKIESTIFSILKKLDSNLAKNLSSEEYSQLLFLLKKI